MFNAQVLLNAMLCDRPRLAAKQVADTSLTCFRGHCLDGIEGRDRTRLLRDTLL